MNHPMFFYILVVTSTGMTMLAHIYQEDEDRSKAMGIAMGGLALGVLSKYSAL